MILWLCIAVRILANPFSNVFQKLLTRRGAEPLFIICAIHGLLTLACLPMLWRLPPLPGEFWMAMSICTVLTVSGNVLIVLAVRESDLSIVGPINAYKPVVSLVPAMLLLNEVPGLLGLGGIALIVAGSSLLVDRDASRHAHLLVRFFRDRGVRYRFAALVISALEAVVMKRAILVSSELATFAFWSAFGFGLSLAAVALLMRRPARARQIEVLRKNRGVYFMLFVTTGLMQGCTIIIFAGFQVGYALALFQTSAIVSVVLGWRVFQERHFVKRLLASAVMVAGAVLIILGG